MDAPALLARPPEEGARRLALSLLDQAEQARPRLDDPAETEALHDFRVALRRLRSCLRAYEEPLAGSLSKKLMKRLRRLAAATGPGRDTEVQVEWLRGRARHLSLTHRSGLVWLVGRLEERMQDAYADLSKEVADEFPALDKDLRARLSVYRTEVRLDAAGEPSRTFGDVTAGILRDQLTELAGHLAQVREAGDAAEAHRARISAKRLRYLLEPLAGELTGAAPRVKRLKAFQDLLGELHDAHVLEGELEEAVEDAARERARRLYTIALSATPDPALLRAERRRTREPGLLALARQNRERRDDLFTQLESGWLGGKADGFFEQVEELAGLMEGKTERKADAS